MNSELIYEILYLSEGEALRLINDEGNVEASLRWYEIIVRFANRHGTYYLESSFFFLVLH